MSVTCATYRIEHRIYTSVSYSSAVPSKQRTKVRGLRVMTGGDRGNGGTTAIPVTVGDKSNGDDGPANGKAGIAGILYSAPDDMMSG